MRLVTTAVMLAMSAAAIAQAEPAKAAPAPQQNKLGGTIKVPPMPPQLDSTLFADPETAKWEPVASLPKGATGALVGTRAADGGMAGWLKFPAGYRVPTAWNTHMVSYAVVGGKLTVTSNGQKHLLGPGGYLVLTSKDKYELQCGQTECMLLVQHFGPPDMHWVNAADAPKPAK